MSDDPTPTSPSERERRERKAMLDAKDDIKRWENLLVGQTRLEMSVETLTELVRDHLEDDKAEFLEVKGLIRENQDKITFVNNAATTEKLASRYTLTQMIGGWLALCGALGMLIGFIGWYLSGGHKP
jgi:hypothetical protein